MAAAVQESLSRVQSVVYVLRKEQHVLDRMRALALHSSGGTDKEPRDPVRLDNAYQRLKIKLTGVSESKDQSFGTIPESSVDTLENASRALEIVRRAISTINEQLDALNTMCADMKHEMPVMVERKRPDIKIAKANILLAKRHTVFKVHTRIRPATVIRLLDYI
jgi:hypothetical protein